MVDMVKAILSAICGITCRSFGSRSLNESSRQISLSTAPPSAKAASRGAGWMLPLALKAAVKGRWPDLSIMDCLIWMIGLTFGTARAQA